MEPRDYFTLWVLSVLASATIVGGKIGMYVWGLAPDPPADPAAAMHWRRRRRWLAYSEVSALPAFGTIGVTAVAYGDLNPILGVLIAMALGAIGFPLFLDGAQWLFRKRLGMPTPHGSAEDA
ncbi:hypothetical protein EDF57_10643 [Novosphingobium sp. PhB55]|uniref:hypothetical protein n=1 Tax=Novosphingobium sp. PhB55 TaxID=2485106 RepID=UPI001064638F|nr:hypothetical protein [Novosphingobium sp. PhB55]TDW63088.1 hypothetical protein EDF57_10643 [Novosphingobium sp. PhB55]